MLRAACGCIARWLGLRVLEVVGVLQEQLDTFVYKALGQTVSSIVKGAVKSNWFPEAPLSDTVSPYMEQLVSMLQVPPSLTSSFHSALAQTLQAPLPPCSKGTT